MSIKFHHTCLPNIEGDEAAPQRILIQNDRILLASSTEALVSEYTKERRSPILKLARRPTRLDAYIDGVC